MKINQLVHSTDLKSGGVAKAAFDLTEAFSSLGISLTTIEIPSSNCYDCTTIAHGLWQWPGLVAYQNWRAKKIPYIVFPHGMLDPWFKKTYPLKHIKKQLYWWWRQGEILRNAYAVCFTTEEERQLAQNTFWPYRCREVVTGLGVNSPPGNIDEQKALFQKAFPLTKGKNCLLYMGRIHPKKGLDLLLHSFSHVNNKNPLLVIAAPIDPKDKYYQKIRKQSQELGQKVLWTDMLEGDLKWGALRTAEALILPSHQENYGMVVAEACSVGTPVLLSNKVNLYREIIEYDAGLVGDDTQLGTDILVDHWIKGKVQTRVENAQKCFNEKLHISKTTEKIITLIQEANRKNSN